MYADDLKIFRRIDSVNDALLLQKDIDSLCDWCNTMKLNLNISKCKSLSFHRKFKPIVHEYYINNSPLSKITEHKDLGVTFTQNMSFNKHIDLIIAKANCMFGFMKRWASDLDDIHCVMVIYFAYIRSQLEYAVPIWCPYYQTHISRIEKVQKKFLAYINFKFFATYNPDIPFYENLTQLAPYNERCNDLSLLTLEHRRKLLSSCLVYNILNGLTDSSFILENLKLQVPHRSLRQQEFLNIPFHRTNYGTHEPINSISRDFNDVSENFDFNISKAIFKNLVKTNLSDLQK